MVPVTDLSALREQVADWKRQGLRVGFVPTMGNLHDGHFALLELAKSRCERVVSSIFVNPTQFGPNEDFEAYPRRTEADSAKLEAAGVDLLWMPSVDEVYPEGFATHIRIADLPDQLCGAARPGHFDGVATVVAKLFGMTLADRAYFGEKDWQQLQVVRRLEEITLRSGNLTGAHHYLRRLVELDDLDEARWRAAGAAAIQATGRS